jgi:serine/threonine protein kinase
LIPSGKSVDIWAVGVIAFAVMGGYLPFRDDNQARLLKKIVKEEPYFEPAFWSHVSEEGKVGTNYSG